MRRFDSSILPALTALALSAIPAKADTVLATDDGIIRNALCVGSDCPDSINTGNPLTLRANNTRLFFDDTSTGSFPSNDWRIVANSGSSGGASYLAFQDATAARFPFVVEAGARANALYVGPTGNVGLGTSIPVQEVHIQSDSPGVRLDYVGSFGTQAWDLVAGPAAVVLRDATGAIHTPVIVQNDTPSSSLVLSSSGFIGLGTSSPQGKLHTYGSGAQLAYFESYDNGPVQVRFRTNSENRRFLAVDGGDNVKTQIEFRDDEILFLGQTVAQEWLRVSAAGIVTAGPSCASPCDAVFDPDAFTVPPIAERAARMWEQKHLPAIGPTTPDQPINLTEKMGGVIHELEVAHIYIGELHARIEHYEARDAAQGAAIAALTARLDALESGQGR